MVTCCSRPVVRGLAGCGPVVREAVVWDTVVWDKVA